MKDQTAAREAFAVIFSPRAMLGAFLSQHPRTGALQLRSLHQKKLSNLELERLTIFNPTAIGSLVSQWYHEYSKSVPVLFALNGPSIEEHMLLLHSAHPTPAQFPVSHAPHMHWKHTYLYSIDHMHCFYLCGIPKPLLFQYQLMTITEQLPLEVLTTERMALAHCYRFMNSTAYRPAQLAQALQMHGNRIERLFYKEDLSRLLYIPANISFSDDARLALLTACGLFAMHGVA